MEVEIVLPVRITHNVYNVHLYIESKNYVYCVCAAYTRARSFCLRDS